MRAVGVQLQYCYVITLFDFLLIPFWVDFCLECPEYFKRIAVSLPLVPPHVDDWAPAKDDPQGNG